MSHRHGEERFQRDLGGDTSGTGPHQPDQPKRNVTVALFNPCTAGYDIGHKLYAARHTGYSRSFRKQVYQEIHRETRTLYPSNVAQPVDESGGCQMSTTNALDDR